MLRQIERPPLSTYLSIELWNALREFGRNFRPGTWTKQPGQRRPLRLDATFGGAVPAEEGKVGRLTGGKAGQKVGTRAVSSYALLEVIVEDD